MNTLRTITITIATACAIIHSEAATFAPALEADSKVPFTLAQTREIYGKLPLRFEKNRGQTDERVRFLARQGIATIFLTGDAAWFVLSPLGRRASSTESGESLLVTDALSDERGGATEGRLAHAVRMRIEGANPQAHVVGENEFKGRINYFRGNDPAKWETDVPTFVRVRFRHVYEGIDLVYYGNEWGKLEYDFVVAPGANADQISLEFSGAERLWK